MDMYRNRSGQDVERSENEKVLIETNLRFLDFSVKLTRRADSVYLRLAVQIFFEYGISNE